MKPMNNLIKKNLTYITLVLMLLWGIGMAFALPPIAAVGFFCSVSAVCTFRSLREGMA
jgi:hypothetical protein